jgi:hypothetical protein
MLNGLNSPSRKSDRRALPRHKYRTTRGWITWLLGMSRMHRKRIARGRKMDFITLGRRLRRRR